MGFSTKNNYFSTSVDTGPQAPNIIGVAKVISMLVFILVVNYHLVDNIYIYKDQT